MSAIYNQLMIAWNNLDERLWVHVIEPKKDTTIQHFLDTLDSKASIWKKIRKHDINSIEVVPRSREISNSGFWVRVLRSNQYLSRQNQFTGSDGVTLNKFLEATTSLAQGQLQSS